MAESAFRAKARRGELRNFTGIDSPYEPPEPPEVQISTTTLSPEQAALRLVSVLQQDSVQVQLP
jgi:bifunctional enzyme CysN/CysC